jgi:hypothetical protein
VLAVLFALGLLVGAAPRASEASSEHGSAQHVEYPDYPAAPRFQAPEAARLMSVGCESCHTDSDEKTMHQNPAVKLGCADCHGGDATVLLPAGVMPGPEYDSHKQRAHVAPLYPEAADQSERRYTLSNAESPEYVRFRNPGDLRVADEACGACHMDIVTANRRSLMATSAMFWEGASYNNGILPSKRAQIGEVYTRDGQPAALRPPQDFEFTPEMKRAGILESIEPLPRWETTPPAQIFRVFERGGRNIGSIFPEIGLPNLFPGFDDPGKPDVRQSNRGKGTGARISVPVLNLHKTRLNDPNLWFDGTNDNPGDFRGSGCTGCHVVYANDRDPISSGSYAKYGHWGQTATADPTIKDRKGPDGQPERGHPIRHEFTRAIPTSQCMVCHLHQPNMFVNSFLGYTMWDYESDAPLMWPEEQQVPSISETFASLSRNPEEAATRGKWRDPEFSSRVWDDVNPVAQDTQFADYHGHGWNFRAVFKRARDGTLLDENDEAIPDDIPAHDKWKRAVHMRDIHADYGMQCGDCHFAQDNHGNGQLYGEVAAAVEIRCRDCHGNADEYATLRTSGPAAPPGGNDLSLLRNVNGQRRFRWRDGRLFQRLTLAPHEELEVTQVKDSVTAGHPDYNAKAARAKTVARGSAGQTWGAAAEGCERAHDDEQIACFSCHSSWVTSCAGCHLPVQANAKTERHHYEGGESRNYASYNPQVARDQMFQLGVHGEAKDGIIAPVRSSSALLLSSTDINRNRIYIQQQPYSSGGYSAQAFAPHFPHTVRKKETKGCTDCHVSETGDNNAIMAQLLLLGTNFVNFNGFNTWVGSEDQIEAIQVTEWDEPQAVIGSYLHRYAFPDWFEEHQQRELELTRPSPGNLDADPSWVRRLREFLQSPFGGRAMYDGSYGHSTGRVGCLQLRGEYLYVAEGKKGMQAFDVQAIGNKGFSERIITAPFSPLGQRVRIKSANATCVALPTNQLVRPDLNRQPSSTGANQEQPMHPIYSYAAITDSKEGLILVDVETLGDFEPRNNFFERAVTWNPNGVLDGARYAHFAGHILYVSARRGIAVVDLDDPFAPKLLSMIPLDRPQASMQQFRYLFAVDAKGFRVVDVTDPAKPRIIEQATVPLAEAHRVYVARTYAYVAAGSEGLVIIDVERPEAPKIHQRYDAEGRLEDVRDVIIASTNASLFAYVADGGGGLKVLQLTSPELQPKFYGFSPEPRPKLIAWRGTKTPALALSRPLERDRAVDETGHQIAVFGRIGSRPFTADEMQELYLSGSPGDPDRSVWTVEDALPTSADSGRCQAER